MKSSNIAASVIRRGVRSYIFQARPKITQKKWQCRWAFIHGIVGSVNNFRALFVSFTSTYKIRLKL